MLEILKNPNFDFLGKARYFVAFSLLLIVAGIVAMSRPGGIHFGVEFSGGTQVIARFQKTPEVDHIRAAIPDAVIQNYDAPAKNQVLIRRSAEGEAVDKQAPAILNALSQKYGENPVVESSAEVVGPVVGAELRRKAVQLTVLGLIFQLIYIAVRFKGAVWGAAATVAGFHDVLVTLAFLTFFKFEITLNVIAALLTLVGYSVNDTIVIFDRARENLRHKRKDPLRKIINDSVNQTLSRTLISNGTTFLAVLGLMFGGEVLRGFAFTMAVGIVVGTYSTIYIASPFVIWWTDLMSRRQGPGGTAKAAL
ncbi:MAG TPA: protein translocase subunit SecF [Vicinamibacteria bacterium]|nr:protein translocase subunit SecF [Vicinamibacteria bacterium]